MRMYKINKVLIAVTLTLIMATIMVLPALGAAQAEHPEDTIGKPIAPFSDVSPEAWYYSAVMYVYEEDIMEGFTDYTFRPDTALNRAQIVTILYRLAGSPDVIGIENPFDDITEGQWWTPQILWAYSQGVTIGFVEDGIRTFRGEQNVTMEEFVTFIARYQEAIGEIPITILADFIWPDFDEVRLFAKEYVGRLTAQGLFRDMPGNSFGPQEDASRATVALVLYNWLERARI